jgi:hypothetical protein
MSTGDSHIPRDERRHRDNEASKRWATRDGEPWTEDEDAFILTEWIKVDPDARDEVTVSKCLERTIVACRRRAQEIRALLGLSSPCFTKKTEPTYIGAEDDPEDQWWSPGYYNGGGSHA